MIYFSDLRVEEVTTGLNSSGNILYVTVQRIFLDVNKKSGLGVLSS